MKYVLLISMMLVSVISSSASEKSVAPVDIPDVVMSGVEKEEAAKWETGLKTSVVSMYIDDLSAEVYHGRPCVQNEVTLTSPWGFYLGVWTSFGMGSNREGNHFGDEVDYYIGWAGSVVNWFDVDVYLQIMDVVDVFTFGRYDSCSATATLSKTFELGGVNSLTFSIGGRYYSELRGNFEGLGDGLQTFTSLGHEWKIAPWLAFSDEIKLVHDDGYAGRDGGFIGSAQVGLEAEITRHISVGVAEQVFTPLSPLHVNENLIEYAGEDPRDPHGTWISTVYAKYRF